MGRPIIPAAALEQHTAVLGKNGSGKTYATKAVIVEPLLDAGKHVAIVDPTSAWWGLRSSASGKGPGFKIIVLGGDHGDLPLPARGGEAVARLVIEQRVNIIADTGNLTVGERTRWMIDFAGTMYRLNRVPLYLVLDEAHVFAPQGKVPDPDTGKMLHAVNQLASGGRSRGIRLTMLTQRPQKLHKDALTTADTLIAMRVLAPHDREAVKAWIDGCGNQADGREVLDSLAQLKRGEGWVWYPEGAHLLRTKFPAIKTFDSSATPTDGHAPTAPKGAAEVDLTEIRTALADAVKEAEANDPKLLRARIAELEKKRITPTTINVVGFTQADMATAEQRGYAAGCNDMAGSYKELPQVRAGVERGLETLTTILNNIVAMQARPLPTMTKAAPRVPGKSVSTGNTKPAAGRAPVAGTGTTTPAGAARLSAPQQRILDGLAWLKGLGIDRADRVRAAMLADQSPRSSGYEKNVSTLKTAGLITYPSQGELALTTAGEAQAQPPEIPATNDALQEAIHRHVSGPQWKILEALIEVYPQALRREELAGLADASHLSSGFEKNVSTLRSLGFIDYPTQGEVAALPVLFLNG